MNRCYREAAAERWKCYHALARLAGASHRTQIFFLRACNVIDSSVYLQWPILLACSLALEFILQCYHVPAALLLGPMMVGLVIALSGARIAISPKVFIGCQAILGCMIAGALSPSILSELVSD